MLDHSSIDSPNQRWLLLFVIFKISICTNLLYSQETKIDSLLDARNSAITANNDTLIFDSTYDVLDACKRRGLLNVMDSIYSLYSVDHLPKGDMEREARYYTLKVAFHGMRNEMDLARIHVKKAISINLQLKDSTKLIVNYSNLGSIYNYTDSLELASSNYLKALNICKEQGDIERQVNLYSNLGQVYNRASDFNQASEYYDKGIELINNDTDPTIAADIYNNSCLNLYKMDRIDVDSVITTLEYVTELYTQAGNKIGKARVTSNIGTILWKSKQYEKAIPYLKKAEALNNEIGKSHTMVSNLISQGKYYNIKGNWDEAEKYFTKVSKLPNLNLDQRIAIAEGYKKCYRGQDRHLKSLKSADLQISLLDSLHHSLLDSKISELGRKYNLKVTQDSIELLSIKNKNIEIRAAKYRRGLLSAVLGIVLLVMILQRVKNQYTRQREINSKLVFQNDELQKLNATLKKRIDKNANTTKSSIINIKSQDKVYKIDLGLVKYAKADNDGVRIFYEENSAWLEVTLKRFEQVTDPYGYVRIYRGTIVNPEYITWINHETLKLKGDIELKIGRTYKGRIMDKITDS